MKETPLVMPKMSMTMTEGTLVTWHKAEGDEVRAGEVVCEVATDKVDMEVEAPADGTLARIVAQPDDVVAVGEPIAYLATAAEDLLAGLFDGPAPEPEPEPVPAAPMRVAAESKPAPAAREPQPGPTSAAPARVTAEPAPAAAAPRRIAAESEPGPAAPTRVAAEPEPALAAPARVATAPTATPPRRVAAVPAARRVAAERGIDLATITPTGPAATIRLADLPPPAPRRSPRAVIARRMSASAQVPQFVVYRDLDVPARGDWTTVFLRALAGALRRHPELNAEWADGDVRRHDHVGVALAVDTGRGLLAPVLRDPDLDDGLAERVRDLVRRARAGKLTLAEMSGGTTTLSNLGGFGVDAFHALLSPPQATALAVGRVQEKVVPVPGGIGLSLRCTVGLTVDHRVGDGADAARLLASVQELLTL
ncbi:dihydrolipoamide acetyltransferase family protein [Amycolatopsis tucumanensis]|uniref:Dihydrolipoamide acetyltransferase component of pyruvate dehydrogenase complex n=1 Tax=Amycolatopsis tucumanensis TaxID=401106 RepID=A0ABP7J7V8_9PSEU|nr:dihydrolipoamide acetyltransferase family protein [Amycolatopsis tucumanensis]MCF6427548.1 2-oxo acid dehydrogenase subunit E2 [Amycolatopsis tucumanensis]